MTGHTADLFGGGRDVELIFGEHGIRALRTARHARGPLAGDFFGIEDRLELHLAIGLLGQYLFLQFRVIKQISALKISEQPVVMRRLVIVDTGLVMTLGTLQIGAQKQPADIAHHQVRVELAVKHEARGRAGLFVGAIGGEHLFHQSVEPLALGQ